MVDLMLPVAYIGIHAILVLLSGLVLFGYAPSLALSPGLFAWLWFNLFVAMYEAYVVSKRYSMAQQKCPHDFWGTRVPDSAGDFWIQAWLEYTCYSDTRYLDPKDTVFYIEGLNAVLVVLMWMAALAGAHPLLMYLLILQAANCLFYFVSLYKSGKISTSSMPKLVLYLLLSSLWFVVPLYLVYRTKK
jgi:hypothetical protein